VFAIPGIPAGGPVARFGARASFEAFGFCDGSVKLRVGACGYLLLDAQGHSITQGWQRIQQRTPDSNWAEFQALLFTLDEARRRKIRSLWVGTDSFQVIEHARKNSARYASYLEVLKEHESHFDYLEVQSIERSRNKEADALARHGIAHLR
jgi:ribonuclease HI